MKIEVDLDKFPTYALADSYQFIFAQWLGGSITDPKFTDKVPTFAIFDELVKQLRIEYLKRPDAQTEGLTKMEKESINKLCTFHSLDAKAVREIWEEMAILSENSLRGIRDDLREKPE